MKNKKASNYPHLQVENATERLFFFFVAEKV